MPVDEEVGVTGWVSKTGVTRLPEFVREKIDPKGEGVGVVYWQLPDGTFRLLTDEQAVKELGWKQE